MNHTEIAGGLSPQIGTAALGSPVSLAPCFLSPVSCLLSPVFCLLSPVSCLLSPVFCLLLSTDPS
jgi:hypothetical protein